MASPRDCITTMAVGLPEATVENHDGHVGFQVRGKRFAWYLEDHHGDGRIALTCKVEPGVNEALTSSRPDRYFLPPYLAARGWVGYWLDLTDVDWDEAHELILDSYRLMAPKRLVVLVDQQLD